MARRASLEDFADPQLQDRRRSVGLAKKITASSPVKPKMTTGELAASLSLRRDQYDQPVHRQVAMLSAFMTRAKSVLLNAFLREDAASVDVLLDAYKMHLTAVVEEQDKLQEFTLRYWAGGDSKRRKDTASVMIEGDDSILKQFTDKSQSFTEAQSALKKLAAATDRTWPRFSEQAILAESSDAIRYNKRAADLMSAAATQRRARVEMTSFMRENSLSMVEKTSVRLAAAKLESSRMAKAFQNTLATQKGVMTITELRGGALSGRHSLEEEHLFERAMESRRQHELSRHYENLVATVKDEISKREASLAHTAVVALDELAGEKGLDAEKTCLHAARSIVPGMEVARERVQKLIEQSREAFDERHEYILKERHKKIEAHYEKLKKLIQNVLDEQDDQYELDAKAREESTRTQNEDVMEHLDKIREKWQQSYKEGLSNHFDKEKVLLQKIGDSFMTKRAQPKNLSQAEIREEDNDERISVNAKVAAKIKAVNEAQTKDVEWVLGATAASYDAVSKLRVINMEEKRLQRQARVQTAAASSSTAARAERFELLVAANMALSQAALEDAADRTRRLGKIARVAGVAVEVEKHEEKERKISKDGDSDSDSDSDSGGHGVAMLRSEAAVAVESPPSPTFLPPPDNDGESRDYPSPERLESGSDWMSPPMAPTLQGEDEPHGAMSGEQWMIQHGFDPQNPEKEIVASWNEEGADPPLMVTALGEACFQGELAICRWLVDHVGARTDVTGAKHGRTTLHMAAFGGHLAVIKWLCDEGGASAQLGATDSCGQTAVHFAVMGNALNDTSPAIRWLNDHAPTRPVPLIRLADNDGETPMHTAVLSGASDLCHWLYVNGAADDLHVKDHSGKTPIDVAVEAGDEELCEWLAHTGHLRDEEV
jgi:hypothetical protein